MDETKAQELRRKAIVAKTRARWRRYHLIDRFLPKPRRLSCPLCLHKEAIAAFRTHESNCIFEGGRLLRYECPKCEVIFGTRRMLAMSPRALGREYADLYAVYNEGDTTHTETQTFHCLAPRPGGIYLNYGCGRWSKSIERLRAEGHQIYGFEPYSNGGGDGQDHIIRDLATLRRMRFDGIMSHNVLEHFQDPVADLRLMASLLRDEQSVMAHATPCYRYKYEFSRFHVFFFTGRSPEALAARAGLRVDVQEVALDQGQLVRLFRPRAQAALRAA